MRDLAENKFAFHGCNVRSCTHSCIPHWVIIYIFAWNKIYSNSCPKQPWFRYISIEFRSWIGSHIPYFHVNVITYLSPSFDAGSANFCLSRRLVGDRLGTRPMGHRRRRKAMIELLGIFKRTSRYFKHISLLSSPFTSEGERLCLKHPFFLFIHNKSSYKEVFDWS